MQRIQRLMLWTLFCSLGGFASGCGAGGSGDDDTETSGTGDTGGATCRDYMTVGTFESPVFSGDASASFDPGDLTWENQVASGMGDVVTVREYPSMQDFVEEAAAVGRVRYTSESLAAGTFNAETTLEYDADARLLSKTVDDLDPGGYDNTTTYSEWDAQGRPTAGTLDVDGGECTAIPLTITYDEEDRKMTETVDTAGGTGAGCAGAEPRQSWKVYDADGNVVEETLGSNPIPELGTTAVLETAEVCL